MLAQDIRTMTPYLQLLRERPVVFDGATGSLLFERGVFVNVCYDELCLSRPALVRGIHADYVAAGADVILTNTFGANREKLRGSNLGDRVGAIAEAGVRLVREAAESQEREVIVAGDVGPVLPRGKRLQAADEGRISAVFAEQCEALRDAGADFLFLETFSDVAELGLAAAAARATGLPVHASVTVDERGISSTGSRLEEMLRALDGHPGVDTLGVNCTVGPAELFALLQPLLPTLSKPCVAKPNAGLPKVVDGRLLYMNSPEYFMEYARRHVAIGVRGFGGCCGTTPAHIREAARTMLGSSRLVQSRAERIAARPAAPVPPPAPDTVFARRLAAGEWVTSVEIAPPRTPDLSALLDKVRLCRDAGVTAVNLPDGPRATSRVSPLATAILIAREVDGIEVIPHFCCRDRNLLGLQSDLLAAEAAHIRNLLFITGDPVKAGNADVPVSGVFDTDSIGLAVLASGLNAGVDLAGARVEPPTGFCIGVGCDPNAVNLENELDRLARKEEAGAMFAITQPAFDAEAVLRFFDRMEARGISLPVLAGLWPLVSYRNAEFMRNEVPGVVVPDAVLQRMAACDGREEAQAAGVELARGVAAALRDRVAGFQVSAPLGNVAMALRVLAP
jgi:methionine synthase I (cobalamin-dependent)/5,10-methylenetetrahydrofolate reductase